MYRYSITKYFEFNISNYNDWGSICDIGKEYKGIKLTAEEYMRVENAYVESIMKITEFMKLEQFRIKNVWYSQDFLKRLKKNNVIQNLYTDSMIQVYKNVGNDSFFGKNELSDLIRLELREDMAGLIYVPYRLKVFIGYDLMMSVYTSMRLDKIRCEITDLRLNIVEY